MTKKITILYFSDAQYRNGRTSNPVQEWQDKQSQVEHGSILEIKTQNLCHEEKTKYSKY